MQTLELSYRETGLGKLLSNLYPWPFELDGFEFASMEGFLQSLKFERPDEAAWVASLHGMEAFRTGQWGNGWKETQILWFAGRPIPRASSQYQDLIARAYDACLHNNFEFMGAIRASGDLVFTHRIGINDSQNTTLTRSEYLMNMFRLRSRLNQEFS